MGREGREVCIGWEGMEGRDGREGCSPLMGSVAPREGRVVCIVEVWNGEELATVSQWAPGGVQWTSAISAYWGSPIEEEGAPEYSAWNGM